MFIYNTGAENYVEERMHYLKEGKMNTGTGKK